MIYDDLPNADELLDAEAAALLQAEADKGAALLNATAADIPTE